MLGMLEEVPWVHGVIISIVVPKRFTKFSQEFVLLFRKEFIPSEPKNGWVRCVDDYEAPPRVSTALPGTPWQPLTLPGTSWQQNPTQPAIAHALTSPPAP